MAEQDIPPPTITAMKIPIIRKGEYDIWSMRMRQYICHTDHNLWDVIVNGDLEEDPAPTGETSAPPAPKTAKQLATKRNQERVKSILLLAIPDEYLLKFHNVADAKSLWEAIKSRLGDINQKFLRSLPLSWNQIALIMRNKSDIDEIDIDDLYNNLRVYKDEMQRSSSSTSTSQNLTFLSSENTSSTNEVSIASGDFGVSTAGGISQIDEDDLEELDLRWQVAMLTVRVKKFIQKTGRNLDFKEKRHVSLDKSKIECYNCHRKGHFARECRSGRNQGRRSYGDNGRSNAPTNESSSQALVAQDGLGGYDWSNDFEVEPVNYALMAISSSSSSSSSDNEVQKCSKQCLESFKTLQKNYDSEREKHSRARLEIQGYELALESLESRILVHEKNELAWGEKYEFQNYELKCREIKINNLNLELEKVVKERDELKLKIEKWEESSKNLDELLNSQMSARDKTGLGYGTQLNEMSNNSETDSEISLSVFYVRSSDEENTPANDRFSKADGFHVIPLSITGNFLTPRANISFAGKTNETNTQKPKTIYESVNKDKVIIEDWNSDDEDDVSEVQTVSPVKTNETQTVKTRVDKIGQTSQKQGIRFKKIKACFVCKSTDHLIKDCTFHDKQSQEPKLKTVVNTGPRVDKPVWDNTKRVNHNFFSKYPHLRKTFVPSGVLTRTGLITPVKQNEKRAVHTVSTARPVSTVRPFAPKIAQTGGAIRPIYPRMDNVRPRGSYSPIKRSYYTKPTFRPKDLKQDVKTFGVQNMTTAGTRAVVNTGKDKLENDLKKSKTCWVWRPKLKILDHDSKNSGSYICKQFDYVDPTGRIKSVMAWIKFNLFSVSQKCDKKNSVLFTESECLILSPSFKLLDESQVVLRAPRKDDVYSLDLKNIVPFGGGLFRKWSNWLFDLDFQTNTMNYIPVCVLEIKLMWMRPRISVEDVVQAAQDKPFENFPKDNDVQDSKDILLTTLMCSNKPGQDKDGVDVEECSTVTPKALHLNAVKRIFRYLKHQPKLGLWYLRDSPFVLEAFSDSDYGGASLDRKSTTCGCQFLGQRLISWQCKKQTIVANSTTKAEYVVAANYCGQVLWIQNQMIDYGFNFMNTKIHIGQLRVTICLVKNLSITQGLKATLRLPYFHKGDCYEKRLIDVIKIHIDSNVADLLTKGFDVTKI
ncbi:ribonuclease H-like domain-containing protein [Tanacetum coccineum]